MKIKTHIRILYYNAKRDLQRWTFYKSTVTEDLGAIIANIFIFSILAVLYEGTVDVYKIDLVTFIVTGTVINSLLVTVISSVYGLMRDGYWNSKIEVILLSRTSIHVYFIGNSLTRLVKMIVLVACIVLFAIIVPRFNPVFRVTVETLPVLLLTLLIIIFCGYGFGLIAAASVSLLNSKYGEGPVMFFLAITSGILTGLTFPVEVLPDYLQIAGLLFPHTYFFDVVRRIAIVDRSTITSPSLLIHQYIPFNPLLLDLVICTLLSSIILYIGLKLFNKGITVSKHDGRLYRWV